MRKLKNPKKVLKLILEEQLKVSRSLTNGLKKEKTLKKIIKTEGKALDILLQERSMTHQELFGKFIEAFQGVELLMKYCIKDKNIKYNTYKSGENFGSILIRFKKFYPHEEVNEWLKDLGRFRGDTAHNYFKDLHLYSIELGEPWKHLEHRSLQKGIRAAEHCMIMLNNIRYKNQEGRRKLRPKKNA